MDIFIYFTPKLSTPKDEIEDALQECLGDRGEVTGSGIGDRGANIDVEVFDSKHPQEVLDDVERVLKDLRVPRDTWLVVDGQRRNLFV